MRTVPILELADVKLRPLSIGDAEALSRLATPNADQWFGADLTQLSKVVVYIEEAIADPNTIPFAIEFEGRFVGTTRFFRFSQEHKNAEIGHTFLGEEVWRTAVNTTCKLLLLGYGFEELGLIRIYFQTDELNTRSRTAILRLGAKEEGRLRNDRIHHSGRIRTTVIFGILKEEWPEIKIGLEAKLASGSR